MASMGKEQSTSKYFDISKPFQVEDQYFGFENIEIYKRDLDYWNKFQMIDHDENKICRKCM